MSSDYKIKISEKRAAELRSQAEELDITINTLIAQIVEGDTLAAPAQRDCTADEAAAFFLTQLEPEHRKLIEDCAHDTHSHPANYIMSYIKLAHDQGNTSKSLPEALEVVKPLTAPTVALGNKYCEWCQKPLEDQHARFCPAPEDGTEPCGRQASLFTIRANRRTKETGSELPKPHVMERTFKF